MEWFLYICVGVMIPWVIYLLYLLIKIKMSINDRKKLVFPEYQPSPVMSLNPDTHIRITEMYIPEPVITGEYNDFKPKNNLLTHNFVETPDVDLLDGDDEDGREEYGREEYLRYVGQYTSYLNE